MNKNKIENLQRELDNIEIKTQQLDKRKIYLKEMIELEKQKKPQIVEQ